MKNALANVNYTSKTKPVQAKRAGLVFCFLSTLLLFGLLMSPAAAAVDWKISPTSPAVGDTLKITGKAAAGESLRAEVSFEKAVPVSKGRYLYSLEAIKVPSGADNLFTVKATGVQNLHIGVKKIIWFHLDSDASGGVASISQGHVPPFTYKIQMDGDALKGKSSVNLRVTAAQTLKADSKGNFEFSYDTSSMPAGKFNIKIGTSQKTVELLPKGLKKPVAAFSASPTSGNSPLQVAFTDQSTGTPASWKWTFGDNTYSTQTNPVHTYSKSGKYTVSLTVTNAAGTSTTTKSSYINVLAPLKAPVAAFSATPTSGTVPLQVTFTDKSTGTPSSWKWTFGDNTYSTQKNPVHIYSKAGKYTVSLTVKNARGSSTKSSYITVSTPIKAPVADFSASPKSGKKPLTVQFTDKSTGSPTSWKWSFGDGKYSTSKNPVHTYKKAGKYTVALKVKNAKGMDTETRFKYVTVSTRK